LICRAFATPLSGRATRYVGQAASLPFQKNKKLHGGETMRYSTCLAAAVVLSWCGFGMAAEKADQKTLEKEFSKSLSGATLVGQFSIDGREITKQPHTDSYEIESAEKVDGHRWIITARIKYGQHDVKLPVPLEVFWAGDTPVMTLTNAAVPGMGTFTSRVMFYGDRYAGTWQHDKIGGHMWGHIEHKK
jgi:hypothetical protein